MIKQLLKGTLTSFVSLCMITVTFQFCCENLKSAFWLFVMAFALNGLVAISSVLAEVQKQKVDKMLKDKLDEIKTNE